MRALVLLAGLAACTPEVLPDSYACGPNALCPENQTCNPFDNHCVTPVLAEPFACDPDYASEPDDAVEQAFPLQIADCVSPPVSIEGCIEASDTGDWYKLTVPPMCAAPDLDTRVTFPVAFVQLTVEVVDLATNATVATDGDCDPDSDSGSEVRCLTATLTPGASYGVHVAPTGEGDCNGDCTFNHYVLRVLIGG